jgi:hypothetical protein
MRTRRRTKDEQARHATRQAEVRQQLRAIVQNGHRLLILKVGGTPQNKQVEVVVAVKKGEPQTITGQVCTLLDRWRGRNGQGGLRLPSWMTPQDLREEIGEALDRSGLSHSDY